VVPFSRFHPLGNPSVDVSHHDTTFDRWAGVVRPRARSARKPYPSGRESTPWPPPSCARTLLEISLSFPPRLLPGGSFQPAFRPEPCRLSSRRFSISVVRLSTSRFSGLRKPGASLRLYHQKPHTEVCMLPLSTQARQCFLTAYRPASGFQLSQRCSGPIPALQATPGDFDSPIASCEAPDVSALSRAPALCWTSYQFIEAESATACWVCRLPLCLRFTVRRSYRRAGRRLRRIFAFA
jgi:hypothetical protein